MNKFLIVLSLLFVAACSSTNSKQNKVVSTDQVGEEADDDDVTSGMTRIETPADILPEDWKYEGEGYIVAFNTSGRNNQDWIHEVETFEEMLQGRGITFMEVYTNFQNVKFSAVDSLDIQDLVEANRQGYLFYIPSTGMVTKHSSGEYGFYSKIQLFFGEH